MPVWSIQDVNGKESGQIILYAGKLRFTGDAKELAEVKLAGKDGEMLTADANPEEWFAAAEQLGTPPYVRVLKKD